MVKFLCKPESRGKKIVLVNPSYLGVGYITPTKHLSAEFCITGESYTGLCHYLFFYRYTINSSVH